MLQLQHQDKLRPQLGHPQKDKDLQVGQKYDNTDKISSYNIGVTTAAIGQEIPLFSVYFFDEMSSFLVIFKNTKFNVKVIYLFHT